MAGLTGRRCLVTGSSRGIGRQIEIGLAHEGGSVIVHGRSRKHNETTLAALAQLGVRAESVEGDLSRPEEVERLVHVILEICGGVDVLYNNAGVNSSGSVLDATEDDWDRSLAVNAKGTFLCSQAAAPSMVASGGGSIINQGSVAALVGIANFASYCAAKGAVVALTRSMSVDLAPRGVRVNAICPGTVYTPLMEPMLTARGGGDLAAGLALTVAKYPIGRLGTPEEIAAVAVFLASDDSSFLTGSVITADGGMTSQ